MSTNIKTGCLVVLILVLTPLAGILWSALVPSISARTIGYRLTVVLDTPEGQRSGSGVVRLKTIFPTKFWLGNGPTMHTEAEAQATVVDLGSRGLLFVTLASAARSPASLTEGYEVGLAPFSEKDFIKSDHHYESSNDYFAEYAAYLDELNRRKPKADLPLEKLPMLVRFRDVNDQTTVERVDPDNLAASFGLGVKFDHAIVEVTDEPATRGIQRILPWLARTRESERVFALNDRRSQRQEFSKLREVGQLTYDDFRLSFR